jgi:putative hemolysin
VRNLPPDYDRFMTAQSAIASKLKHRPANVPRMFQPIRKLLRETEVNAFLRKCETAEGFEFVEKVLEYFDCSYSIVAREIERIPAEGAVVLRLNRPPSLLEAATLLKLVRSVRRDVRLVANARLNPFEPLRPLLVSSEALRAALENGEAVIATAADLAAERAGASIVGVRVRGANGMLLCGLLAFFKRGRTLRIRVGEPAAPARKAKVIRLPRQAPVAHPEDRLLVRRELQGAELLGRSHDGKQILLHDGRPDSAVLRELGRLREIAFRQIGEGTGKRRDVDAFDSYYRHVVLWDDAELQIVGAYRIAEAARIVAERGAHGLYTHALFSYGDELRARFPEALELGRSFVQPRYQGMSALDYLWLGVGAYLVRQPRLRYLFGAVSMSAAYPEAARRMLAYFYGRFHGAGDVMATPRRPLELAPAEAERLASLFPGRDYQADWRRLKHELAAIGVSVPVLFRQYTELCEPGGTRFLGFSVDPAFGNCVDALVLVDLHALKPAKRSRYLRPERRAA